MKGTTLSYLRFLVPVFLALWCLGFAGWYSPKALVRETPPDAFAQGAMDSGDPRVEAHLLLDHDSVASGGEFRAGVFFEIDPDWHIYWRNSGESGLSTEVDFEASATTFGGLNWTAPEPYLDQAKIVATFGYSNHVLLWSMGKLGAGADGLIDVTASIDYLACKVECIPGSARLKRTLKIGRPVQSPEYELFEKSASEAAQAPNDVGIKTTWAIGRSEEGVLAQLGLQCEGCAMEVVAPVERYALMPDEGRNVLWKTESVERSGPLNVLNLKGEVNPDGVTAPCALRGVVWVRKNGQPLPLDIQQEFDCEELKVAPGPVGLASRDSPSLSASSSPQTPDINLFYALLLAFLGGMILNLMPCVFPVLAIKVFSFVKLAHETKSKVLTHSIAYTVGVVGSMLALASVVVGLKVAGTQVGWGFQFQEPLFIVALAAILVLFALNLFGVFEVSLGIQTKKSNEHTLRQSVGEGVLAVVLATPCSAPFLGTAVGFALSASYLTIFLIFFALGLGLAFPFVVMTLVPGMAKLLPRPGQWMIVFKQVLGFVLIGTTVWLVWILGQSTGVNGVTRLLIFLTILSLGAWAFGQVQFKDGRTKWLVSGVMALLVAFTGYATLSFSEATQVANYDSSWEVWSHERVDTEIQKGSVVFVDFTADWCITCKVNEGAVLNQTAVETAFKEHSVVKLKGDWTRRDEEIRKVLESFGKGGVPLYLVYGPGLDEVLVLPEILTEKLVVEAIEKAVKK